MKKVIIKIILFLIASHILISNCTQEPTKPTLNFTGSIEGVITDFDTGIALEDVAVLVVPDSQTVLSNNNGEFIFNDLVYDIYTIFAQKTGYYEDSIKVNVSADIAVPANLRLKKLKPNLSVSTTLLDFSSSTQELKFIIDNSTDFGSLDWVITKDLDCITVSPVSGTVTTDTVEIVVNVDRSNLNSGNYSGKITVSSNFGERIINVKIIV